MKQLLDIIKSVNASTSFESFVQLENNFTEVSYLEEANGIFIDQGDITKEFWNYFSDILMCSLVNLIHHRELRNQFVFESAYITSTHIEFVLFADKYPTSWQEVKIWRKYVIDGLSKIIDDREVHLNVIFSNGITWVSREPEPMQWKQDVGQRIRIMQ